MGAGQHLPAGFPGGRSCCHVVPTSKSVRLSRCAALCHSVTAVTGVRLIVVYELVPGSGENRVFVVDFRAGYLTIVWPPVRVHQYMYRWIISTVERQASERSPLQECDQ